MDQFNGGKYVWPVPVDLPTGRYRIRLTSASSDDNVAVSPPFAVRSARHYQIIFFSRNGIFGDAPSTTDQAWGDMRLFGSEGTTLGIKLSKETVMETNQLPSTSYPNGSILLWDGLAADVGDVRGYGLSVLPQRSIFEVDAIQVNASGDLSTVGTRSVSQEDGTVLKSFCPKQGSNASCASCTSNACTDAASAKKPRSVWQQCQMWSSQAPFSPPALPLIGNSPPNNADPCIAFDTCTECLQAPGCSWCPETCQCALTLLQLSEENYPIGTGDCNGRWQRPPLWGGTCTDDQQGASCPVLPPSPDPPFPPPLPAPPPPPLLPPSPLPPSPPPLPSTPLPPSPCFSCFENPIYIKSPNSTTELFTGLSGWHDNVTLSWVGGPYAGSVVPALKRVSSQLAGSLNEEAFKWKTEEVGLPSLLQSMDQFDGGEYVWPVPVDLPTGRYRIRLTSTSSDNNVDVSPPFAVHSARHYQIKFLSRNGTFGDAPSTTNQAWGNMRLYGSEGTTLGIRLSKETVMEINQSPSTSYPNGSILLWDGLAADIGIVHNFSLSILPASSLFQVDAAQVNASGAVYAVGIRSISQVDGTVLKKFCPTQGSNCASCTSKQGCGFCEETKECVATVPDEELQGPIFSTCSSPGWEFTATQCSDPCTGYDSCTKCLRAPGCSWCPETCQCALSLLQLNRDNYPIGTGDCNGRWQRTNLFGRETCTATQQGSSCAVISFPPPLPSWPALIPRPPSMQFSPVPPKPSPPNPSLPNSFPSSPFPPTSISPPPSPRPHPPPSSPSAPPPPLLPNPLLFPPSFPPPFMPLTPPPSPYTSESEDRDGSDDGFDSPSDSEPFPLPSSPVLSPPMPPFMQTDDPACNAQPSSHAKYFIKLTLDSTLLCFNPLLRNEIQSLLKNNTWNVFGNVQHRGLGNCSDYLQVACSEFNPGSTSFEVDVDLSDNAQPEDVRLFEEQAKSMSPREAGNLLLQSEHGREIHLGGFTFEVECVSDSPTCPSPPLPQDPPFPEAPSSPFLLTPQPPDGSRGIPPTLLSPPPPSLPGSALAPLSPSTLDEAACSNSSDTVADFLISLDIDFEEVRGNSDFVRKLKDTVGSNLLRNFPNFFHHRGPQGGCSEFLNVKLMPGSVVVEVEADLGKEAKPEEAKALEEEMENMDPRDAEKELLITEDGDPVRVNGHNVKVTTVMASAPPPAPQLAPNSASKRHPSLVLLVEAYFVAVAAIGVL